MMPISTLDRGREKREMKMEIAKSFRRAGVTIETIAKAFGVHENTVKAWTKGWDSGNPQGGQ